MPNFTKQAIKASFWKLLNQQPLSQISVRTIVEDCGINRNSFYYHFQDIPSMIEEMIMDEANALIEKYPNINSVDEMIETAFRFTQENKRAIAPTATSGKSINATESIEPVMDLFYMEEGIQNLPTLVANIKENRMYYERCWDIPAKTLIELAAIRQKYIDQAQSITLYYKKPESARELWEDIKYAMELGIKTLYYMKTPKANFNDDYVCESCS